MKTLIGALKQLDWKKIQQRRKRCNSSTKLKIPKIMMMIKTLLTNISYVNRRRSNNISMFNSSSICLLSDLSEVPVKLEMQHDELDRLKNHLQGVTKKP